MNHPFTLPPAPEPAVAEIDLGALRHNARLLQARAGAAGLMAVVKADAYGHGAVPVVRALQQAGVQRFAVATLPEALRLRAAGIEDALLVFSAPLEQDLPHYAGHDLAVAVTSVEAAEWVAGAASAASPLRVHVKVDTGMHRLGIDPADAPAAVRRLERAAHVSIEGLWTHFATADDDLDFARTQWARFERVAREVGDAAAFLHAANSAALLSLPETYAPYGARALVRPGIALYGQSPSPETDQAAAAGLRPVMRLRARISHVQTVQAGETVSYGRRWRADAPTRVATVAIGYADGYRRALTGRAEAGVGATRRPLAGTVCMDMIMIDLGAPGGPGGEVRPGDEVVLFGKGGPTAFEVARWAGTIPYEICCGISARVSRRYLEPHP